jgi:membrane protein EpsK
VPKNLIANVSVFILNIIIGLFLVPFFIDSLGIASYALIPLATSFTSYVSLVVQSLNTSVYRYLTIDLQKKEYKKANATFNTSLFGTLGIILSMIPIALLISYYAPTFFDIPSSQENDARFLFLAVITAFLLRTWGSNFESSLFAYNRLDLLKLMNGISIIIQVGLIVLLFKLFSPNLIYVGIAYLASAIVNFIIAVIFSRKVNPHLKVNIKCFQRSRVKELVGTGGWLIINDLGGLLFLQIDLIIVNKLFGTVAGGEYAIVLTWSSLLRSIAGLLVGVVIPVILTYYAKGKIDEMINLSKSILKFTSFAMALPIGYICGFAPQILSLWVGPEYAKLAPLMFLMLSHLVINLPVRPLFTINIAYNDVRTPGVVTLVMGGANLLLSIVIPYLTGWGYYGVAVAGAIMLTLKNAFFIPWYATKVLGISRNTFTYSVFPGVIAMLMTTGAFQLVSYYLQISGFLQLIICGVILTAVYMLIVWEFGLTRSEKQILGSFVPLKVRNRLHFEVEYH